VPEYRLDDLAREAGVATTTVRLYQNRGLLPGPRLVGRTGWYDDTHLERLRLIGRLQQEGFSLSSIRTLLDGWEGGRRLDDVVGIEHQLDALLGRKRELSLTPEQLAGRFPTDALTPDLLQRAAALGLVEPDHDGGFRVPDERFLTTGAALLRLGVPAAVVLAEWEALVTATDEVAARFIDLFEQWVLPGDWRAELTTERTQELAASLQQLRDIADQVLIAAMDASVARIGAARLAELIED
jgi:DNA-binding transcriptional MerR regulator